MDGNFHLGHRWRFCAEICEGVHMAKSPLEGKGTIVASLSDLQLTEMIRRRGVCRFGLA